MCNSSSVAGAQQASQQLKISVTVAKKAQDATAAQGAAIVKMLDNVAKQVKTPGLGAQIDSTG